MIEAQAKRTRLKVWKDYLIAAGGTPYFNDTLHTTLRRIAELPGISDLPNRLLLKGVVGTAAFNDAMYPLTRKLALENGSDIGCCNMPPIQILGDASTAEIPPVPEEGDDYLAMEGGQPITGEGGGTFIPE